MNKAVTQKLDNHAIRQLGDLEKDKRIYEQLLKNKYTYFCVNEDMDPYDPNLIDEKNKIALEFFEAYFPNKSSYEE